MHNVVLGFPSAPSATRTNPPLFCKIPYTNNLCGILLNNFLSLANNSKPLQP